METEPIASGWDWVFLWLDLGIWDVTGLVRIRRTSQIRKGTIKFRPPKPGRISMKL